MSEIRINQTKGYVLDKAKELGLVAFFAQPNELFLDMDDPKTGYIEHPDVLQMLHKLGVLDYYLTAQPLITTSNGGNRHIYFSLATDYPESVRITWQAALGSDPLKEMLAAIQASELIAVPVVLFETAVEAKKVEEWRELCSAKK